MLEAVGGEVHGKGGPHTCQSQIDARLDRLGKGLRLLLSL